MGLFSHIAAMVGRGMDIRVGDGMKAPEFGGPNPALKDEIADRCASIPFSWSTNIATRGRFATTRFCSGSWKTHPKAAYAKAPNPIKPNTFSANSPRPMYAPPRGIHPRLPAHTIYPMPAAAKPRKPNGLMSIRFSTTFTLTVKTAAISGVRASLSA